MSWAGLAMFGSGPQIPNDFQILNPHGWQRTISATWCYMALFCKSQTSTQVPDFWSCYYDALAWLCHSLSSRTSQNWKASMNSLDPNALKRAQWNTIKPHNLLRSACPAWCQAMIAGCSAFRTRCDVGSSCRASNATSNKPCRWYYVALSSKVVDGCGRALLAPMPYACCCCGGGMWWWGWFGWVGGWWLVAVLAAALLLATCSNL